MNSFEKRGGTPPPSVEPPKIFAGVKKNPDGTRDYSNALVMEDPEGKLAAAMKRGREEKVAEEARERAKKFEIPKDIKLGSAERLNESLRVAINVNREYQANSPKPQIEALIKKFEKEREILDKVIAGFSRDLIISGVESGKSDIVSAEEAEARARSLTAGEARELVSAYIAYFEDKEDTSAEGKTMLAAARDLESRLGVEALNTEKN